MPPSKAAQAIKARALAATRFREGSYELALAILVGKQDDPGRDGARWSLDEYGKPRKGGGNG